MQTSVENIWEACVLYRCRARLNFVYCQPERLAPLTMRRAQLRVTLKALGTILQWSRSFRKPLIGLLPLMLRLKSVRRLRFSFSSLHGWRGQTCCRGNSRENLLPFWLCHHRGVLVLHFIGRDCLFYTNIYCTGKIVCPKSTCLS